MFGNDEPMLAEVCRRPAEPGLVEAFGNVAEVEARRPS